MRESKNSALSTCSVSHTRNICPASANHSLVEIALIQPLVLDEQTPVSVHHGVPPLAFVHVPLCKPIRPETVHKIIHELSLVSIPVWPSYGSYPIFLSLKVGAFEHGAVRPYLLSLRRKVIEPEAAEAKAIQTFEDALTMMHSARILSQITRPVNEQFVAIKIGQEIMANALVDGPIVVIVGSKTPGLEMPPLTDVYEVSHFDCPRSRRIGLILSVMRDVNIWQRVFVEGYDKVSRDMHVMRIVVRRLFLLFYNNGREGYRSEHLHRYEHWSGRAINDQPRRRSRGT